MNPVYRKNLPIFDEFKDYQYRRKTGKNYTVDTFNYDLKPVEEKSPCEVCPKSSTCKYECTKFWFYVEFGNWRGVE